jgi:hypothetical protein
MCTYIGQQVHWARFSEPLEQGLEQGTWKEQAVVKSSAIHN